MRETVLQFILGFAAGWLGMELLKMLYRWLVGGR